MADIKTKDIAKGTIKTIDKAAVAGERMKQAYISTKDKAEHSVDAKESSVEEFASDKYETAVSSAVREGVHQFDRRGRKAVKDTKDNIYKAKDGIERFQAKRAEAKAAKEAAENAAKETAEKAANTAGKKSIKTIERTTERTIKQSARSSGKRTVKTLEKGTYKVTKRSVKTAERTAKTTIKTAKQTAKAAEKTAKASIKAAQKAAQAARAAAKAAVATTKAVVKATIAAVKAIIAAIKGLISLIVAGGWVAVVVIIVICMVALLVCSAFGIFFGIDTSEGESTPTLRSAISQIQGEFNTSIENEKANHTYTYVDTSGAAPVWKEVLAIYSVKTATDPNNPQEVVTMDEGKIDLMREVFWEMNSIQAWTEDKEETVTTQYINDKGEVVTETKTVTNTYLYIIVNRKSVEEMANTYGFNDGQKTQLYELLSEQNDDMWESVLSGTT